MMATGRQFLLACALLCALPVPAVGQKPPSADERAARGDALTLQQNHEAALAEYQAALAANPDHAGAAWKISRSYVRLGEAAEDKARKVELYRKAVDAATKATEAHPRTSDAFTELAIALGRVSSYVDAKEALELSKDTKKAVDRAIELNPSDDAAWQVLGQWHRRLATVTGMERTFANMFLGGIPAEASVDTAIECFKKAIALNPVYGGHYLELAATYAKVNRRDEAVQAYQKVLQLPASAPGAQRFKDSATASLEKLSAKQP
jgi:regulator of microtubule dynamics protein 3